MSKIVKSLSAWFGALSTENVTVESNDGELKISGTQIIMKDALKRIRMIFGLDKGDNKFKFQLKNELCATTIGIDDDGNAVFSGTVKGGSITSDTTINVTTDATIGNKLILKNDDVIGGTISVYEGADTAPTLNIRAEGSRPIMISTGTGTVQFQCNPSTTYIRGKNELRLGTTDGEDRVYINNELAVSRGEFESLLDRVAALESRQ